MGVGRLVHVAHSALLGILLPIAVLAVVAPAAAGSADSQSFLNAECGVNRNCGRSMARETMLLQRQWGKEVVDAEYARQRAKVFPGESIRQLVPGIIKRMAQRTPRRPNSLQLDFCDATNNEQLWAHLCGHWEKVLIADAIKNGVDVCCDSIPAPCRFNRTCSVSDECIVPSCDQEEWYLKTVEADAMEAGRLFKATPRQLRRCIFSTQNRRCGRQEGNISVDEAGQAVLRAVAIMDDSGLQATAWEVVKEFAALRERRLREGLVGPNIGAGNIAREDPEIGGDAEGNEEEHGKEKDEGGTHGLEKDAVAEHDLVDAEFEAAQAMSQLRQRRAERSLLAARSRRELAATGTLDAGVNQKVTVL